MYATYCNRTPREIESELPTGIAFTAYSGYRRLYGVAESDYGEVYVYATEDAEKETRRRFPQDKRQPNLYVLRSDKALDPLIIGRKLKANSVPPAQLFVDLWNINTWYAKEYADALWKRIMGE